MARRSWHGRGVAGRRRLAAAWSSALALLLVGAAGASAAWTAPINLTAAGQGFDPQAAVDADGDAVLAWQIGGLDGVAQTRARSSAGALSSIQDLSLFGGDPGEVSFEPDVAVDDAGTATYAWGQYTQPGTRPRVQTRSRSVTGALSPIRMLSPVLAAVENIHVDVDSEGDAVFVWQADLGAHDQVQARTLSAAGVLGPLLELSAPGQDATHPQVAVDADGDAVFAWQRLEPDRFRTETRPLSAAGVLGPTEALASARWSSTVPQVALNPAGEGVFVWRSAHPQGLGSDRVETRARLATGTLTRRQTVADASGDVHDPQVAIDETGAALYAWVRSQGSVRWVKVRPRAALGALGQDQTVVRRGAPQSLSTPRISLDADGDAVIAWEELHASATTPSCCTLVKALTRSSAGAFSATDTLSPVGVSASGLEIAADPDGDAVAVWTRSNTGFGRIQGAAGP